MQLSKTEIKSNWLKTLNSAIADHRAKFQQLYDEAIESLAHFIHIDYLIPKSLTSLTFIAFIPMTALLLSQFSKSFVLG
jgi:hypothetical protein